MLRPDYYADRILDVLNITRPGDLAELEAIAWERGALVTDRPLHGAEARIAIHGRRAIITVSTAVTDPRRRRFSIAHELGHFEMHRRLNQLALCTSGDLDDWEVRQANHGREHDANEFAAALLLPERFFASRCQTGDPSLDLIRALSQLFEVSLTAAARRFITFTPEPCAVVFSQDGYIRWFQGSREFQEMGLFVDVKSKLDPESLAALHFRSHAIPARAMRVDAATWFRPGRYRQDATVREQSYAMPSYNAVLTLLWVDDEMDFDEDGYDD